MHAPTRTHAAACARAFACTREKMRLTYTHNHTRARAGTPISTRAYVTCAYVRALTCARMGVCLSARAHPQTHAGILHCAARPFHRFATLRHVVPCCNRLGCNALRHVAARCGLLPPRCRACERVGMRERTCGCACVRAGARACVRVRAPKGGVSGQFCLLAQSRWSRLSM